MSASTKRQPAIFLPHGGGPCFFMDWTWGPANTWKATETFLAGLADTLPEKPRAILAISAHWEAPAFTVSAAIQPELIYDYYGFPERTYDLSWPAPGSPEVAARVATLLREAGLPTETAPRRGFDHGVFVPLKVVFPQAEIPVVSMSLAAGLDPAQHLASGRALALLRDEGVLIVASGMSFHNLGAYLRPETVEPARFFDAWLNEALAQPVVERDRLLTAWQTAPYARFAHPREEHLIPLLVAAGAGGDASRVFQGEPMGAALSAWRFA